MGCVMFGPGSEDVKITYGSHYPTTYGAYYTPKYGYYGYPYSYYGYEPTYSSRFVVRGTGPYDRYYGYNYY